MHQRMRLNLPFTKPSGKTDRGTVLRVWGCGTGPRMLAHGTARRRVPPRSLRDLRRTQTSTQERKVNKGFTVELESGNIKIGRQEEYFRVIF